jgi:hypothetical protein
MIFPRKTSAFRFNYAVVRIPVNVALESGQSVPLPGEDFMG